MVQQWRNKVMGVMALGVALLGLVGALFGLMALAPCKLQLTPGMLLAYELQHEHVDVDAEGEPIGSPKTWTEEMHLLCLSDANEAALMTPGAAGQRDEVTLLRFEENGAVRRMDPALRLMQRLRPSVRSTLTCCRSPKAWSEPGG